MNKMKDWVRFPLGEVAPAKSNKMPEFGTKVWNLSLNEIESGSGRILQKTVSRVQDLGSTKCSFDKSHVLYSKLRPYLNKVVIPDESGVGTSELIPLKPDSGKLDREYLAYYLRSPLFLVFANDNTRGANLPRIAMNELWKYKISFPKDISEQRRIVFQIKECFKQLDEMEMLRVMAINDAKMIYQSICHDAFNASGSGSDWTTNEIGDIATTLQYGYTQSADRSPVGPKFLRITDIQNHSVNWDSVPYCKADWKTTDKYKLKVNDILFARTGATTGKSFFIDIEPPSAVFASYLIRLRIDSERILPRLVYHFFQSPHYWNQIRRNMRGGAQPNINSKVLASLSLSFPKDLEEQKNLIENLDAFLDLSLSVQNAMSEQSNSFIYIRESILRKAFAGEL